ncbi:MAG: 3-hydroxyacyl-CoA dehydrogenase family protein [Anaerolineales bacterium]
MKILLVGTQPFIEDLAPIIERGGHDVDEFTTVAFLSSERGFDDYDAVIEVENTSAGVKHAVLRRLPADIPLHTCALAVSTTLAASWIRNPERMTGFGVLPTIPATGMVEVARGLQTDDEHFNSALAFWQSCGQQVITVADSAGLVRARMVCAIINEALSALQEGVASAADIDLAMKLGTNYPRGPLEWGDAIGLDTVLGVMEGLQAEWGEDRYRPTPLLRRLVAAELSMRDLP